MEVKNKISINTRAYLYDPTRTSTLRKVFEQAMNKRFNKLIQTIVYAIVKDDCFGLKDNDVMAMVNSPGRRAFAFTRNSDKVSGFMAWLDELVKDEVLQISNLQQVGTSIDSAWTNKYISDSYKRGVQRARYEMKNAGYNVPSIEETGGISASMSTPFHLDRVGVLWTRTFNELKGVTDAMSQQISRVLSEGMIEGDNPVLLGRKLAAVIKGGGAELGITDTLGRYIPAKRRAQMIARTEIIRAHHQATIQEYKNWGLEGVTVKAEWSTVGDNRVCKQCESMDGHRFTLAQIENMIPAHVSCRCIALPYKTESKRVEQPRDEVADNFINTSDKIKYLQYKKEFDKAFKDLSPQDKNVLKSLRSTTKSKELYGIKDQEETLRIMKLMQKDSFESMQSFINHVLDWKYSTQTAPANALKYTARKLEKGIPKMVFRKDAKLMIEDLQNTINIFEWDWDDVYIKWRAFSQSYMEGVGIGNEMTLYRGMSGGTVG